MSGPTFRCGHPRTAENSKKSPSDKLPRCKECRRNYIQISRPRFAEEDGERHSPDNPGWINMCRYGSENLLSAINRLLGRAS